MADHDLLHRPAVARYIASANGLTRAAPIALSRIGFIDEWMKMDAREAARWSTSAAMKHHADLSRKVSFTFESMALCAENPRIWQMVLKYGKESRAFLMAESGAARMRMLDVLSEPRTGCKEQGITAAAEPIE